MSDWYINSLSYIVFNCMKYSGIVIRTIIPAWGTPSWLVQWCAIGVGTSRGSRGWGGTLLVNGNAWICVDTMHLEYPMVLLGSECSATT